MADGSTLSFDLENESEANEWFRLSKNSQEIRAVAILHDGHLHTLPLPKSNQIRGVARFSGDLITKKGNSHEIVAERVAVNCGEFEVSLTVYRGKTPKLSRTDVALLRNHPR